ncbi:MAG: CPBP family glutamic-type intramembrane protease [Planctomycetota bacterium]|nr:CPBP family glutamic-type intramembrane protease [Planctomycetota bacterium]
MPTGLSQPLLIFGILVALLTSFRLWLRAFGRLRAGQQILPHEPRRLAPWGLLDVLGTVVLLVVLQAAALSCLPPDWRPLPGIALEAMQTDQRIGVLLASALAELAAAGISLVAVKLRSRASWRDLGFDVRKIAADVRLGSAAFLMLAPPVYVIQMTLVYWFPSQHPLIVAIKKDPDLLFLMLSGFTAVIVAPLAEEYFFRVLLQGWCERIATAGADLLSLFLGGAASPGSPLTAAPQGTATASPASHEPPVEPDHPDASSRAFDGQPSGAPASRESPVEAEAVAPPSLWPIGLSAGLFAAMHASHGPDPIPLFLLAVGLGYLYQRTHRILPCLVVHFLLNSCSMVMLLVDVLSMIP